MPRLQIDSLIIDYQEEGSGVPIIFIPGFTEYKEVFSFQFRGLQDSYRVISYDVRRGLKRPADYTLELLVSDLHGLLTALDIDSTVICGHSFGGLIAMQFALQYPENTKALILVSSFPDAPDIDAKRLQSWISSAGYSLGRTISNTVKVRMAQLFGMRTSGTLTREYEVTAMRMIAQQALRTPPTTISQRMRIIQKADFRSSLSSILIPALVVAGSKDRAFFLSSAQQLYEELPDASLEVIEGGGHFSFVTRHDQFNTAIDEFLTEHLAEIT